MTDVSEERLNASAALTLNLIKIRKKCEKVNKIGIFLNSSPYFLIFY